MEIDTFDAKQFWLRYDELAPRDFPVLLKTGIAQSTLSTWRTKSAFPRADEAYMIANALNVSLEYLITGQVPHRI